MRCRSRQAAQAELRSHLHECMPQLIFTGRPAEEPRSQVQRELGVRAHRAGLGMRVPLAPGGSSA